jgi:hypothetical protein
MRQNSPKLDRPRPTTGGYAPAYPTPEVLADNPPMKNRNRPPNRKSQRHNGKGGFSGPPPHLAANAAAEALRLATLAAASGKLTEADRQMRLAERLGKLGCNPLLGGLAAASEESGEDFRRELEQRINRVRAEERAQLNAMKRANPERWQAAFDAALEEAIADARASTIAFWTGDPHLFEEAG